MCFKKSVRPAKILINFNYHANLSEMEANIWEGRNESDWSFFPMQLVYSVASTCHSCFKQQSNNRDEIDVKTSARNDF